MKIIEEFVESILREAYPLTYQFIYDQSTLLQYLDGKMKAVHGDSKSRRSLANIYAVYSILFFYKEDFCNAPDEYRKFDGYDYIKLFHFYRNLYGGNKLQNHALNSRVNGEFKNKFPNTTNELIVSNNGKYLIHIDYLYVDDIDISNICCKVIEKYIHLLKRKDNELSEVLEQLTNTSSYELKRNKLKTLLSVDAEARIFEICSLTVACLTSNNTSSLHIQSFSSFYHSILLFRHQFFKPGTLDNNKLVCAFPFLQHFIHPEQTRTLARHNKQPSSNNRGIFFTLNSMKSRNYHSIFISKLLTD